MYVLRPFAPTWRNFNAFGKKQNLNNRSTDLNTLFDPQQV